MAGRYRRFLHHVAANVAHYSGILRARALLNRAIFRKQEVYVLGLHRVLTREHLNQSNSLPGMILMETTFAKMLEYICGRCETVSLGTFLETDRSLPSGRTRFLFTFDDGWRDNYSVAYPLLKKFGVPAVIFVSVGAVEQQQAFWIERLVHAWKKPANRDEIQSKLPSLAGLKNRTYELEQAVEVLKNMPSHKRSQILHALESSGSMPSGAPDEMLTWDQVLEMERAGIEIGSHTVTHPLLTYESDDAVQEELSASKRALEKRLGRKVRAFAYPNGDANESVARKVREAGYDSAFVTRSLDIPAEYGRFSIRRVILHEGNVTGRDGEFSPAMFRLTLARSS